MSDNSVYQVSQITWKEFRWCHDTQYITEYVSKEEATRVFIKAVDSFRFCNNITAWSKNEVVKENYYNYKEWEVLYKIEEIETIKRNIIFIKKEWILNNLKDQYIVSWTEYNLWATEFFIENMFTVGELLQFYNVSEHHIENLLHRVLYTRWGIESIYDSDVSFLYTDLISLLKDYDFRIE